MLTTRRIKIIHRNKNTKPLASYNYNMNLLENKILYWTETNPNPKYAFTELIKETNESLEYCKKYERDRVIRNFDNIIYFLDETVLENIINDRYYIKDCELKESIVELCKEIKSYNRIISNISKLDKKTNFKKHMTEYEQYLNYDRSFKENYMECIVNDISNIYKDVDNKILYSITNECILVNNIISNLNINTDELVEEMTKAFVKIRNIENSDIIYVQENSKIECNNKRLLYLLSEEKVEETKEGLKISKRKPLKDLLSGFELDNNKSADKLKSFMKRIYEKPINDIIDETPNILSIIRKFFIVGGTFVINPILGIVVGLTDYVIESQVNIKSAEKHLKQLESEKNKAEKKLDNLKSEDHIENTKKYIKQLEDNIKKIDKYIDNLKSDKERSAEWDFEESNTTIIDSMACVLAIEECFDLFDENNKLVDYLCEGKISNSLKLASENLKGKIKKLSGKEKMLSQKLDGSVDGFIKSIEASLTNKKREDIIKGRILPSFSRMMKIGLTGTAAFAINPMVAAIGAIGSIAVSKVATRREKQFILDEIEIHLKIVDKKIQQAEMNGDDDTLEDLYKLQLKLKREKQRIKYNMKVYYKV